MKYSLCSGWEFTGKWSEEFLRGSGEAAPVRLPHTCREMPLHYADSRDYEMLCGYRKVLDIPEGLRGKRIFLQLDGAGHIATVYLNGTELGSHRCGYTAFRVELTEHLAFGGENLLAVKLDSSENPQIPPFGFVIDYLTYGGLYREAWLDVRESSYIADIYITTPRPDTAAVQVTVENPPPGGEVRLQISDPAGKTVWKGANGEMAVIPEAKAWDTEHPHRYTCEAVLLDGGGGALDRQQVTFGFRTAEFRADGFYLNGKKTFLRGLNRHQSFPYVGYAAPESLQREDARILKKELGCNAVRTSHYPQSGYFLDECDRLGLLVFTELPGWQHVGDADWKEQACENLREMILEQRNHPSIILWGVRINESQDDDGFYLETNRIAHALDPSRQTSGVRYLEGSSLLEDVYAFNDFSHTGGNLPIRPKKDVTPDMGKAFLISECNGHMYPTKPFDDWAHRQEQALRHARVQNAAMESGVHAGCFGWCMFDYPTHKDFGSGDRVCYHGVMDAFRNPKLAAAVYGSQGENTPVLEVGSSMDIGDYPGGRIGRVYVFSNGEEVRLYRNGHYVGRLGRGGFSALPHGPFVVEDTIGELLESQEGLPKKQADELRECLLAAGAGGAFDLPEEKRLQLERCMEAYGMRREAVSRLYDTYVSGWGGSSTVWRFDAVRDGQVVKSVTRCPSARLHTGAEASCTELSERQSYDMAAVRVRLLDENGNPAVYGQIPVCFEAEGDLELVGPETVTAEGGMCGTYVRSVGRAGSGRLTIRTGQTAPVTVTFTITVEDVPAVI